MSIRLREWREYNTSLFLVFETNIVLMVFVFLFPPQKVRVGGVGTAFKAKAAVLVVLVFQEIGSHIFGSPIFLVLYCVKNNYIYCPTGTFSLSFLSWGF